MSRQTSFPGIIVDSIEADSGSMGRMLQFEEGLPEDIPSERIESFLNDVAMFWSDAPSSSVTYNLEVAAYTEASAKLKSRAFVRVKNPFEADIIEVEEPRQLKDLGVLRAGRKAYEVSVRVDK